MPKYIDTRVVDEDGTTLGTPTNPLVTTATLSGDVNVDQTALDTNGLIGKNSGGDFTIAYASATTLTLGTYPDGSSVTADDIVAVQHIDNAGAVTATYSRDDKTMSMSGNVLTVTGAAFAATDSFIIYTNVPRFVGGSGNVSSQVQRVVLAADVTLPAPGTGATSLGKAIDSAVGATDTGVASLVKRVDSLGAITPANGDYTVLQVDNQGALWVSVSGPVNIGSVTPGTTATSLGKAEDDASANGDVGVGMLAVRKATPANTSSNDGDYEFLQMSAGRLWVSATVDAALPAGDNNIGNVDIVTLPATTKYTVDKTTALEAYSVSKGSAGTFYKLSGRIDASAATDDYYLQLIDNATVPVDGAVTFIIAPIRIDHVNGVNSTFDIDVSGDDLLSGIAAANGIVWGISTTEFTKTAAGSVASATALVA